MAEIAYRIVNGKRNESPVRAVDEALRISHGFYAPDDVVEYICCGKYERTTLHCSAKLQLACGKKKKAYFRLVKETGNHHLNGCQYNCEAKALTALFLSRDLSRTSFLSIVKSIFMLESRSNRKRTKSDQDKTAGTLPYMEEEDTFDDRITNPRPRGAKTLTELYRICYQNDGDAKFKDGSSLKHRIILRDTIIPVIEELIHLNDYAMVVAQKSRDPAINHSILYECPELRQPGELLWVVTDPYIIDPQGTPSLYIVLSFESNNDLKSECVKKLSSPLDNQGLFLVLCKWEDKGIINNKRVIKGKITTAKQIEALPLLDSVEPKEYFR